MKVLQSGYGSTRGGGGILARILLLGVLLVPAPVDAQPSAARLWNEALLDAIRHDFARPTVHARNLFHTAAAMYDAWAAYDGEATPYLLGRTVGGYTCQFEGIPVPADMQAAQQEALSYAAYRLLLHRFHRSPGARVSRARFDSLLTAQGYDASITATDYQAGSPAALGNHIAQCLIRMGIQDGSNELNDYAYQYYQPANDPLIPALPGNPGLSDPNRWQPLTLQIFIDQAGNVIPGNTPRFLGPEWGQVVPFALSEKDLTLYRRDNTTYRVFHDPGAPPYLDPQAGGDALDDYQWTFALVAIWSSHLDPADGVLWDISPASKGHIQQLPQTFADQKAFYNLREGGDPGRGYTVNPRTGQPYRPQVVPRGDYTRVLAEFWADGPASETPPGHWFTILNYVNDHPLFQKKYRGNGPVVDDLAWDVKAYFALGGAVHDAAVAAWGVKGWYDYLRPISALRAMADRGQRSDPGRPHYAPGGFPLVNGYIELVEAGDPLAGENGEHLGKIKLYAWRGPGAIVDPATDKAGVGWVLAEDWWPYQRPSFVTPPFAGYVSGHSTFSRAAAEVLTLLTGDAYFPGGLGEFPAPRDAFLVFEAGPSVDVTLQWATYRDASDQCSLSRIWGGIHPPVDDMPGRLMGEKIGVDAFLFAERYFTGQVPDDQAPRAGSTPFAQVYPNPVAPGAMLTVAFTQPVRQGSLRVYNALGQVVHTQALQNRTFARLDPQVLAPGMYLLQITGDTWQSTHSVVVIR